MAETIWYIITNKKQLTGPFKNKEAAWKEMPVKNAVFTLGVVKDVKR